MHITKSHEATRFETPNAVMHRHAPEGGIAVWRAELPPGSSGPWHSASTNQVIVVLEGRPTIRTADDEQTLSAGDSAFIPAGAERQIANQDELPATTVTSAPRGATATARGKDAVSIPWAA